MIRTIHRARYVLTEPDLLLQDAAVHISRPGRISRVEPWHRPPPNLEVEIQDWGSAIILPGLINAHTHLELTNLEGRLRAPSSFADWLDQLIELRSRWTPDDFAASARRGGELSLSSGTTLVADVSASGRSRGALRDVPIRKVVLEETIGLDPARARDALADLEKRIGPAPSDPLTEAGISPHAPYTVSPELYRGAAALAREKNVILGSHVGETRAELEFLASGGGELRAFLSRRGALPDGFPVPALSPVAHLEALGVLQSPALLFHCNYLDEDSLAVLLKRQCSVVYCPRSHAFFEHERHPVREMLDCGINVALGTDSLASNSDLSILEEMRFLFDHRDDLEPGEIFRMATVNGAAALQSRGTLGRLRRGSWGDMTILDLPEEAGGRNLLRQILEGAGSCRATFVQGEMAWRAA